jgi:excisionase family DNA binding protein
MQRALATILFFSLALCQGHTTGKIRRHKALENLDNNILTVTDVAKRMKVNPQTVRSWIYDGALDAINVSRKGSRYCYWRIPEKALENFIEQRGKL